jgi:hypothetical protein
MKTKTLSLSRTDFPIVTSLDNLEVGRIYRTKKYEILKPLKFNRGKKEGYLLERVAAIIQMIIMNEFMFGVCHVLVNLKGYAIDGNNRKRALMERGEYVNFMITGEPRFNLDDESEILNNVSDYNSINTAWFANDAYLSALEFGASAAVAIERLKVWLENENGMPGEMFTPSRLIALALKDKTGLAGKVQRRRAYCNNETAAILESDEFKKLLTFLVNVIQFVQVSNSSITPWFVVRCLLPVMWKKELSEKAVLSNVKKRGFKKMDNTKMVGVKVRVTEILKMGNV